MKKKRNNLERKLIAYIKCQTGTMDPDKRMLLCLSFFIYHNKGKATYRLETELSRTSCICSLSSPLSLEQSLAQSWFLYAVVIYNV